MEKENPKNGQDSPLGDGGGAGEDELLLGQYLFAAVRVFARRPAAAQHTLGRVLELCRSSERAGSALAKRAAFYAALLSNPTVSKSVLFSV